MGNVGERLSEIGKKPPLEVFYQCLTLHEDMIRHVHKPCGQDFVAIKEDIKNVIENNEEAFKDYTVTQFKALLNYKVKMGIQTVGHHGDLLEYVRKETIKSGLAEPVKPKEETKRCPDCDLPKTLDQFREIKKGHHTKKCISCLDKKAEKRSGPSEEEQKESELEKLRRKNAELAEKVRGYEERSEDFMTEEEWLAKQEGGKGLYFMSAILKCPATGELHNFIDQVEALSESHAVGEFVLHDEVKSQIIISISHEKSIRD